LSTAAPDAGEEAHGVAVLFGVAATHRSAVSGRASFVIAHRLSTIQESDQILVIDDGQEVQRGPRAGLQTPWASTVICTTISTRSTLIRI
jgi:ABC-type protease/lipase transport system fused ATPase/permease subunit